MASKATCAVCGESREDISGYLGVCPHCVKRGSEKTMNLVYKAHSQARASFGLPGRPPTDSEGLRCDICGNKCQIPEGGIGYCGLTRNKEGKLLRSLGAKARGLVSFYSDPHPTNCVAAWVCAGGTGAGYPKYTRWKGPETGFQNGALFLGTCSYHCLYCQNTSWHQMIEEKEKVKKTEQLVNHILSNKRITCICWFGGSPEPQMPFVYEVSTQVKQKAEKEDRILRVCLEANGNFSWKWLERVAEISLKSGGGIKFDLKTWNEDLNLALSGISNSKVKQNFKKLGAYHRKREEPPFLRASTPLVPGYIDEEEIRDIAKFIAEVDPSIPYSLLAFSPRYMFYDMPLTSKKMAFRGKEIAEEAGLQRVRVGNKHLLN